MELVELGIISRPHGFKGDFVVLSPSGDRSALGQVKTVYLGESPDSVVPYPVKEAAWMPRGWKLSVDGINSDVMVKTFCGFTLFANRSDLPLPAENEYYVTDLQGATVVDAESGKEIGKLSGVEPGIAGQDRWWIEGEGDSFAVPATKRYIERVDVSARKVWLKNLGDFS